LPDQALDLVFTSNFFEHLSNTATAAATLGEAYRCLRPGGRLVALGPNIKYPSGALLGFWDHHLPLTKASSAEGLQAVGFQLERVVPRLSALYDGAGTAPCFLTLTCHASWHGGCPAVSCGCEEVSQA
jgi:SAM-dependent methyltransferase